MLSNILGSKSDRVLELAYETDKKNDEHVSVNVHFIYFAW